MRSRRVYETFIKLVLVKICGLVSSSAARPSRRWATNSMAMSPVQTPQRHTERR